MPITADTEQKILNHFMDEVEKAKRGELDVFDVATRLTETYKSLKDLYNEIKPLIIEKRERYHEKEDISCNGYSISVQSRKYYDYSEDTEHELIKERLKNRESLMRKASKLGKQLTDSETGETVPPASFSESTYPVLKWQGNQMGEN